MAEDFKRCRRSTGVLGRMDHGRRRTAVAPRTEPARSRDLGRLAAQRCSFVRAKQVSRPTLGGWLLRTSCRRANRGPRGRSLATARAGQLPQALALGPVSSGRAPRVVGDDRDEGPRADHPELPPKWVAVSGARRRGRDSNSRYADRRTTPFEGAAFNRSATPPGDSPRLADRRHPRPDEPAPVGRV